MDAQADGGGQAPPPSAAAAPPPPVAQAVARTGYQGFGSFHSDNVEEMACDPMWQPPPNPCEAAAGELPAPGVVGTAARRHFLIDFSWTFINHGAFGGALRCAQQEAEAWRRRCEAQPLLFLDRWALRSSEVDGAVSPRMPAGARLAMLSAVLGTGKQLLLMQVEWLERQCTCPTARPVQGAVCPAGAGHA